MQLALAINGGTPVRKTLLPYARQSVNDDDVKAVTDVLRSDWLTTGPNVAAFEEEFAAFTGAKHAVAVCNGTAALHAAYCAAGIRPGDEVIVPAMTFSGTANAAVFLGGTPVFADSDPETLLIDAGKIEQLITKKTKAIVCVDYAGQPCDYEALCAIAAKHKLILIADACHALGGSYKGKPVGALADLSTFSFHPAKTLATGEGGMITTDNPKWVKTMRQFRNHGVTTDHRERQEKGSWFYEMEFLGYNYRLSDIHCALGRSQLKRVPEWVARRQEIAKMYGKALANIPGITLLKNRDNRTHGYHLYVIQVENRDQVFSALRAENIMGNVHYIPVHLHPYYRKRFGTMPGLAPVAEAAYRRILSLPMFASMTDRDVQDVITAVTKVCSHYARGERN